MDSALGILKDMSFGFSVKGRLLCIIKEQRGIEKREKKLDFGFTKSVTQVV